MEEVPRAEIEKAVQGLIQPGADKAMRGLVCGDGCGSGCGGICGAECSPVKDPSIFAVFDRTARLKVKIKAIDSKIVAAKIKQVMGLGY